jgi:16S rRNA processing protein RimM
MSEPAREPREGYVAVGRVLRPWGLRGDLKVESLTDFAEDRYAPGAALWLDGVERTVELSRSQKGALYVKLAGIDDATTAEKYRGLLLEVPEASLPPLAEDEFYHHQLVGLRAMTVEGEALGTVAEVLATGGNPVLLVHGPSGELALPFVEDVVKAVDLPAGTLTVELMEGLLPSPKAATRQFVPRRHGPRAPRRH